ncbi:hypothetical protein OPT61_g1104 [Boeremia exigua]|uniref:Uncharacterized protein n=1 Tax=Boeremia exigua TaxID=749465 RepID=A0ACC2IRJ6_9PLEO|nr:hypothetical protein OPT61_g1104 [Boeremia exigua]
MLRRLSRQLNDERDGLKLERKRSKRERISQFFRTKSIRKTKPQQHNEALTDKGADRAPSLQGSPGLEQSNATSPEPSRRPTEVPKTVPLGTVAAAPSVLTIPNDQQYDDVDSMRHNQLKGPVDALQPATSTEQIDGTPSKPQSIATKDVERDILSEESAKALFSGAPSLTVKIADGRPSPKVLYPWDSEVNHDDATDSAHIDRPSYLAATAHTHTATGRSIQSEQCEHQVYRTDAVETPNWLSAQGIEPGSVGFAHFVELPLADHLNTEPEYDEGSEEFTETARNKDLFQTNPERIGIRAVNMDSVYDRLIELQDLYEAFQQSPERITILNNQSPGDLYAHLFSTFLTPPGYAGADLDPTGLQVQILAIVRILNLKGIWYDFSLVEWRIRLGQVLFSDPEPVMEDVHAPLWSERDVLLLQISLSCELLLRLDAISATRAGEVDDQAHVSAREVATFTSITTRKMDWDMTLARRFLENILVIKGDDSGALTPVPEKRGLFSILGGHTPRETPTSDIIFLPQHQSRQLSGLLHFAESMNWPNIDTIVRSLAEKLGDPDQVNEQTPQASSPSAWSFNPTTPSVVSVYGTPLQTPRSANEHQDDYFGRVQKPIVRRGNSQSLRVPLSKTLLSLGDSSKPAVVDIGGWLSRSFLTGLILPGEAISHLVMSTLLENDKLAISVLGDSADLYGGFVYNGRSWWSKASVAGRVLACSEKAQECMGWVYVHCPPQDAIDGWHSIRSEQSPISLRVAPDMDLVAADSSVFPTSTDVSLKSTDFILPKDLEDVSQPPAYFLQWDLTPLNLDLIEDDTDARLSSESDVYTPSLTFQIGGSFEEHVLTLTHEVQFVTSWPCFTPASTSAASPRHVSKRSWTGTLSHKSSKKSVSTKLSRRNSHGFEPLLSHPPEAAGIGPQRTYVDERDNEQANPSIADGPVIAHPLHASYSHRILLVTSVLDTKFVTPFTISANQLPTCSSSTLLREGHEEGAGHDDHKTVLVLDARGFADAQLLARAWCAEKGFHAVIGRVERTCLACCIREARGLGINIVIRPYKYDTPSFKCSICYYP